jgi:hypothetical protein
VSCGQKLFNCVDDNALINQLLTPFDEGHEVHTMANANKFCEPVSVANSWQNFPANPEKISC